MYLNRIMSAVYGEEVRGAIHDAINAMNIESSEAMSAASTAQNSATNSASAASQSASTASTKASAASSSASAASTSASNAASSASTASTKASEAATSASNASSSAYIASQAAYAAETANDEVDSKVAKVMAMKSDLMDHAIYQELMDSNGYDLIDSTDDSLLGRTLFADMSDIVDLRKDISDLTILVNSIASLLISGRLTSVESWISEASEDIARLNEHALLDSTFI
jgi:hypothetical protein